MTCDTKRAELSSGPEKAHRVGKPRLTEGIAREAIPNRRATLPSGATGK